MASEFIFHIRNASPNDMAALLGTLRAFPDLGTVEEIVNAAQSIGYFVKDRQRLEALITARNLGLVEGSSNALTPIGCALADLEMKKPDVFPDVVHGLVYIMWDSNQPGANCFSWSYRTLCKLLWSSASLVADNRQELASKLETAARLAFPTIEVVISRKSVDGAFLWLRELDPPVLDPEEKLFGRRGFCSPELFVLALDLEYREAVATHGSNLLLSERVREHVCRTCLIEPAAFERVLDYAVGQFDFLNKGIGGGWGSYVTLHRAPSLEDFI